MSQYDYNERIGWGVSLALHAGLAVIFLFWMMDLRPFELEFTLVSFSSTTDVESGSAAMQPTVSGNAPLIELPTRPMLEETSTLLKLPESSRQAVIMPSPQEKLDINAQERVAPRQRTTFDRTSPAMRDRADMKPLPLSDEVLTGKPTDQLGSRLSGDDMFSISWDGPVRTKISGALPEYPPEVNKAVTVRISFDVAADGAVVFMSPLTKGQPQLEKVSMEALRNWRFNSLDLSIEQKKQKGIVTFIFELR